MRLLAVALLAAVAAAQERAPFLDLVWRVGPDGEVRAWPDWRNGEALEDAFEPRPLFPPLAPKPTADDPDPERFADVASRETLNLLLRVLLSGPTDLASLTDAGHHFRKLRLPQEPAYLAWPAKAVARDAPLQRRARLDRILAVRLLGQRWPDWDGQLERIAGDAAEDPFVRLAAEQALGAVRGTGPPRAETWVPDALPAGCDFYAAIDHRAIPPAPGMAAHLDANVNLEVRCMFLAMGAAATWPRIVEAQWSLDRGAEFPYELARRFGNAAPRRTWVAGSLRPEVSLVVHVDGLFETEPLRAAATGMGAPVEGAGEGVRVTFGEARVVVAPTSAELRLGPQRPLLTDAALADLKAAGLGGGDAVWIHLRDHSGFLPAELGVKHATLRASFHDGVAATLHVACADDGAATRLAEQVREALARLIERAPPEEGTPGVFVQEIPHDPKERERLRSFLRSVDVRTDGSWLAVAFHREGETPWTVFRALLEG